MAGRAKVVVEDFLMDAEQHNLLSDADQRVARASSLRADRIRTEDEFRAACYRIECVERTIATIREEIDELENPSLLNALFGLLRDTSGHIEQKRDQQCRLQQQFDEHYATAEALEKQIHDIDRMIEQVGEASEDYEDALAARTSELMSRGGKSASALIELSASESTVDDQIRTTMLAIETGQAVIQRLSAMTRSVKRARRKRINLLMGFDPATAFWNFGAARCAKPQIARVREGLMAFHRRLSDVDKSAGTDDDTRLLRLTAVMEQLGDALAGRQHVRHFQQSFPMEEEVRTAIRVLESKIESLRTCKSELASERRTLIEND